MGRPEFNNYTFYKFSCLTDNVDCCYVGSTANFYMRQFQHKSNCNSPNSKDYNKRLYEIIRANGGWENWKMIAIEELQNISLKEARMKEEEYRINLKANLNVIRAYISVENDKLEKKERYEKNKEKDKDRLKEYNKQYYLKQKEMKSLESYNV